MAWVLFTCLMMSCVAAAAEAYSLTVNMAEPEKWAECCTTYGSDYDPNKTVTFGLYRIGEPDGTTESAWKTTAAFEALNDVLDMSARPSGDTWTAEQISDWQDKAVEIIGYDPNLTQELNIAPDYELDPVEYGNSVSIDIDVPGIYMGVAISKPDRLVVNPFTVAVPSLNEKTQEAQRNVTVNMSKTDYIIPDATAIAGRKIWLDENDFDGIQPEEITVRLTRKVNNGDFENTDLVVTAKKEEGWEYSFNDLPVEGSERVDGKFDQYMYSVVEDPTIDEYVSTMDIPMGDDKKSFNIVNTHEPVFGALRLRKAGKVVGFADLTAVEKDYIRNYIKNLTFVFTVTGPINVKWADESEDGEGITRHPKIGGDIDDEPTGSDTQGENAQYNYYDHVTKRLKAEIKDDGTFTSLKDDIDYLFSDKLMPGKYVITEEIIGDHEGMSWEKETEDEGEVTVLPNTEKEFSLATLNNPQRLGCLKITKTLKGDGVVDVDAAGGEFTFIVKRKDKDGTTTEFRRVKLKVKNDNKPVEVTLENLLPGTYVISEDTSNMSGATLTNPSSNEFEVKVKAGKDGETPTVETAAFENKKDVGGLKITKSVTSNGSASAAAGMYEFTVTGPNNYKKTVKITIKNGKSDTYLLNDLVPGEYTIKEDKSKLGERVTLKTPSDNVRKCTVKAGVVADASNAPEAAFLNEYRTPPPGGGGGNPTPTPSPTPTPTPTPTPAVNMNGQKRWDDESDVHKVRPSTITIRLYADGVEKDSITVSGSGNTWNYDFGTLPAVDEYGNNINYTVLEDDVSGYTTTYDGRTIINDLIEQPPKEYTNLTGNKTWIDNNNENGNRPNYIVVRLMRDGVEVERRTVTAANGWQFSFNDIPKDDGYGHTYTYTLREDPVPGYFSRVSGTRLINTELPPPPDRVPTLNNPSEEDMEDLLDLFGYDTPLFGELLGTGDITPLYPFIFGGVGGLALITLVVLLVVGKKKRKNAA